MYLVLSAARRPLLLHKPTHTELKCLRPGCRRRKILETLQRLEPLHPSHLKVYFTITDKRKSKLWLIGPRLHQLCPRSGAGAKNVTAKHLMWTSLFLKSKNLKKLQLHWDKNSIYRCTHSTAIVIRIVSSDSRQYAALVITVNRD